MIERKRPKATARGTPRLTPEERSEVMIRAWAARRARAQAKIKTPAKTKKAKSASGKVLLTHEQRSEIARAAAALRKRRAIAALRKAAKPGAKSPVVPAKKKKLLTHAQRSRIAKAAAALRRERAEAAERKRVRVERKQQREQRQQAEAAAQAKLARKAARNAASETTPVIQSLPLPAPSPPVVAAPRMRRTAKKPPVKRIAPVVLDEPAVEPMEPAERSVA